MGDRTAQERLNLTSSGTLIPMIYTIASTEWELKPFVYWWEERGRPVVFDVRRRVSASVSLSSEALHSALGDWYQPLPPLYPVNVPDAHPVRALPESFEKGVEQMQSVSGLVILASSGVFPRSYRRFLGERLALHIGYPVAHVQRHYRTSQQRYLVWEERVEYRGVSNDEFPVLDWLLTPEWTRVRDVLEGRDPEFALSGYELSPDSPLLDALLRYSPLEPAFAVGYLALARESATTRLFDIQRFETTAHPSLAHAMERVVHAAQAMPTTYARAILEAFADALKGYMRTP